MGFWDDVQKENDRKRAEQYESIDNPNKIAWISVAMPLFFCLVFFVFCPMGIKKSNKEYAENERLCYNNFYKCRLFGTIKAKERLIYKRVFSISVQPVGMSNIEILECHCKKLNELYEAVNIGDTILKPADTLLVKIFNSPKYEELNRYETFKKK